MFCYVLSKTGEAFRSFFFLTRRKCNLIFSILFLLSPVTAAPGKDLILGQHLNLTCSSGVPLTSDLRLKWIPPDGSSLQPPTSDRLSIPAAGPGDGGMWRCELWRNNTLLTTAMIALKIGECRKCVYVCVCVWREEEGRKSNKAVTSLLYHIQSLIVCVSALQQSPFWVCGCWWSSAAPQPSSSSSSSSSASSSAGADERGWALPLCWSVVIGATRQPFHPPHCVFIVWLWQQMRPTRHRLCQCKKYGTHPRHDHHLKSEFFLPF